jgi:hypothetical protein
MKKTLVPLAISLALCGAATMALVAGSARAQPAHNPMMVAAVTNPFAMNRAAPPPDAGGMPRGPGQGPGLQGKNMPSPAQLAALHKRMCQDAYAHQVGDLAYLEAKLGLTAAQQPLFDRWKSVKLDLARRGEADCATRELPFRNPAKNNPVDIMARQEDTLKRRLAEMEAERPVLTAFYNSLSQAQKTALLHPGPEAMMNRHRMFSDALAPPMPGEPGMGDDGPPMGPPPPQ